MRIADRIGEPFPPGGCTAFACAVASAFHSREIEDPLRSDAYLRALAEGQDMKHVSGCNRVDPPLCVGDILVWGIGDHQHMGVVAEGEQVLHAQRNGGSRLTPLSRVLPYMLTAWRPSPTGAC